MVVVKVESYFILLLWKLIQDGGFFYSVIYELYQKRELYCPIWKTELEKREENNKKQALPEPEEGLRGGAGSLRRKEQEQTSHLARMGEEIG